VGLRNSQNVTEKRKISYSLLPGLGAWFFSFPFCSLVTVLTELLWLIRDGRKCFKNFMVSFSWEWKLYSMTLLEAEASGG
jgi:hypothetical protein